MRNEVTKKQYCPLCDSRVVTSFLKRARMPVHQNLVMDNQEAAIDIERGELDIAFCAECGFVFNRAFDPDKLSYNANYENTQTCSPSFSGYVDALVEHLIRDRNIQNCRIVEVGCGKGEFLRKLVTGDGARNSGYGFDPAYIVAILRDRQLQVTLIALDGAEIYEVCA